MTQPIKILIADDETEILDLMAKRIAKEGYAVSKAHDGEEAWEKIRSESPDVILLDLTMPKMDGLAVLKNLRDHPPTTKWQPVIIISAMGELEDVRKGLSLEADHYLTKPCQMDDVLRAIRTMVSLIPLRKPKTEIERESPLRTGSAAFNEGQSAAGGLMRFSLLNILKGAGRILASSLIIVVIGMFLFTRFAERTSIFYPDKHLTGDPGQAGLVYDNVFFPTADHLKLHGWFLKSGVPNASVIIYMHGNAGHIGHRIEKMSFLLKMGVDVFLFDYRGYGLSQGNPTEKGLYLDALAAYDYVVGRGVSPQRIVAYGTSLGGAAASDLAAHRPLGALIIDSSFPSAAAMSRYLYPFIPSFFLSVKLDSAAKLAHVNIPKLFLHSPEDEMIPFAIGKKFYEAAADPKEFLTTHGHHNSNYIDSYAIWYNGVEQFLKKGKFL